MDDPFLDFRLFLHTKITYRGNIEISITDPTSNIAVPKIF